MTTAVKFFHSSMPGAPVLAGQVGTLATLLDTLLVNGFGSGQLDSLVIAGGTVTATRAAGHPQEPGTVVNIAGASVSGGTINGDHRVLTTSTNTFTFAVTGIPDQTATGTITAKLASAGWTKPFSGSNLAVFRSSDPAGTQAYLRVDDTDPQVARVVGYGAMSDVDTGSDPFPNSSQIAGGGYWAKSNAASAAARSWTFFADSRAFYLIASPAALGTYNNNPHSAHIAFGDLVSAKSPDAYAAFLQCSSTTLAATEPGTSGEELDFFRGASGAAQGLYAMRSYTGLGSSSVLRRLASLGYLETAFQSRSGDANGMQYPNGPDGGLYVANVALIEASSRAMRGTLPGFYGSPQNIGNGVFALREAVTGVVNLPNRTLRAFNSSAGAYFVDATGPWR